MMEVSPGASPHHLPPRYSLKMHERDLDSENVLIYFLPMSQFIVLETHTLILLALFFRKRALKEVRLPHHLGLIATCT